MSRFTGEYVADRKAVHNAVRESVGNRCVRCGHPQGDKMFVTGDVNRVAEAENGAEGPYTVIVREEVEGVRWRIFLEEPCTEHCTHAKDGKLRILTVHHLTGQKDDNRWWNLLALCQVCHLQVQARVIPERPWLFAHTDWFRPYVCGFYAAYYGQQDITREQADAEPDRWLAMGQPWLYEPAPSPLVP